MISPDPRLLRYQRLRDEFATKIAAQEWRPGEAIPGEHELAKAYGIAVGTVRKALEGLAAEGLLERIQGRGTFVRRAKFDGSLFRFFRFQTKTGDRKIPTSVILSREILDAPSNVASALQLQMRAKVIHMFRLRIIDQEPVLIEDIWLPHERFHRLTSVDLNQIGDLLYPAYEEHCGQIVASASETLTVESVSASDAKHLQLRSNAPIVVIERLAFGYDRVPLEWRCSRGPATHFCYHVDIR